MKTMWIFKDYCFGREAVFDSEEKAKNFMQSLLKFYIEYKLVPPLKDDYKLCEIMVNPTVGEYWQS